MKENDLHTILNGFQKPELQDLGNLLGRELSPRLRKSQLVEELDLYLRADPGRWMSHLMERDVRLLRDLVHAGPEKVQNLDYAVYPALVEVSGLVEHDDSDEQSHKVWISREMYDIVSPFVEKVLKKGEKSGQYALERIGLGYLNLYGILPTDMFIDLLMTYFEAHGGGDFHELSRMLHQSPLVKLCRYTDKWGDYVCSPCISDVDEIYSLREQVRQTGHAAFTEDQAREAGAGAPYFTVGMRTPEGMALEQLYRRLGYEGFELVKAEHDTWIEAQYTSEYNEALFHPLMDSPLGQHMDEESWKACCRIVADYADSVPKWALNGVSAKEAGQLALDAASWDNVPEDPVRETVPETGEEYPHWQMPEPTVSDGYEQVSGFPMGFAVPHVAPDDPCPCGSGLRYCRCHGKYLS
ncbi:MAG: SEC-C domain-containing protein [Bacteroidales bacterium]|nr:SEC-C domain-containing protein [Bacteroidales bacterium]